MRLVAEMCCIEDDLGVKGKSGVLQSMESRSAFLSNESHRIQFVDTPKHGSWLNQIETWHFVPPISTAQQRNVVGRAVTP